MNVSNPQTEPASSPAPRLARFSVWLPLGIIIFSGYLHRYGGGANSLSHPVQVALGFAVIAAALGGFACGIAALCHRGEGETNVVGKSILGLALSSFLILMFLIGFVSGFQRAVKARESVASLRQSIKEANADVRRSFDPTNGITANPQVFDKTITAAKQASKDLPGESGLVLDASAAYLTELQRISKAYDVEFKKLQSAQVLTATNLTSKDQIQPRQQLVSHFLQVNDDVDRFVASGETAFKTELVKRNVSQQRIQLEVDAFHRASQPRTPLVRDIRETDRQIGAAMLNILGLYESEWGRWRYDAQLGKVFFSDATTLSKYNDYLDQIGTSAKQQLALQRRLLDIQTPRTSTR